MRIESDKMRQHTPTQEEVKATDSPRLMPLCLIPI
ncbi:hypothetical protein CSUI_001923 [Cystoisospora suis]|uniref:Uncharacterized protein n=1 Tax=Cystoisospora suis TaxID=483139 RepID=A0A2C6KVS7_9APIC|nr:hypothetical protein CSUI_001923 [Cystoisospora suis]